MDILDVVGHFGRAQKEVLVITILRSVALSFSLNIIFFSTINVNHWCAPVDVFRNMTSTEWKECCVPKSNGVYSECQHYEVDEYGVVDNNSLVNCQRWEYDRSTFATSLKMEMDLVCDRSYYVSVLYITFFSGSLISQPVAGYFADRFGRRTSIMFGCTGMMIANTAVFFIESLPAFLASRFIIAVFYTFLQTAPMTLFLELCGREQRPLHSMLLLGAWSLVNIAELYLVYSLNNWRHFILIGSFPICLPYLLITWKFLPESPRWLITRKRYEEAKQILQTIATKNGIIIHDVDSVMAALTSKAAKSDEEGEAKNGIRDFLKDKQLLTITGVLLLAFFVNAFVGTGFFITLNSLGKDYKTNFVITQCTSLGGSVAIYFILVYITRRRCLLIWSYMVTGLSFILVAFVGEDLHWLRVSMAMLGKTALMVCIETVFLYVTELLPTKFRSRGTSMCMTSARIGSFMSSFTDVLSQKYGRSSCYFLFGGLTLFTSICYFLLPELDNKNLPDTVTETKRNVISKTKNQKILNGSTKTESEVLTLSDGNDHRTLKI